MRKLGKPAGLGLFTLIELLVVVAIISILAGLLLPALNQAKIAAQTITCMNRQKQVYVTLSMYRSDNDEWWPQPYHYVYIAVPGQWQVAATYMDMYDKIKGTWGKDNPLMCPSSISIGGPSMNYWQSPGPWAHLDAYFDGFVLNTGGFAGGFGMSSYWSEPDGPGVRRGDPPYPSLCLLMVDSAREHRLCYWYVSSGRGMMRFRHGESRKSADDGKLNMTYADGHVRTWQWMPGNPIYPLSGNGLWTWQDGFMWWGNTWGESNTY